VGRATPRRESHHGVFAKRFFDIETVGIATIIFGVLVCAHFAYTVISHL
jgi:hypothetical protein